MVSDTIGSSPGSWAGKSASEIREIGKCSGSILLVPVGSMEQHGDHLPVSTDTILVDAVANLGVKKVFDELPILKTPPIWTGYSPHHLPFGGTITLEHRTLLSVIEEGCLSALSNGFDAVLLLNGHGGNMAVINSAVSTIGVEYAEAEISGLTYFRLAGDYINNIRESEPGGMFHGGEFETSLMMHLRPDLLNEDSINGTHKKHQYDLSSDDLTGGGRLKTYHSFDNYSDSGAIGDPEYAKQETGEAIYDRLGDELECLLRNIHRQNSEK